MFPLHIFMTLRLWGAYDLLEALPQSKGYGVTNFEFLLPPGTKPSSPFLGLTFCLLFYLTLAAFLIPSYK